MPMPVFAPGERPALDLWDVGLLGGRDGGGGGDDRAAAAGVRVRWVRDLRDEGQLTLGTDRSGSGGAFCGVKCGFW